MKSYGQYCALARGLDAIGDRWLLLIVRELLGGPRRYGELLNGLPGVATNLLSDRLRTMEANGLVAKADDRYRLTPRGEELREVVSVIGRWAGPLMERMTEDDAFRGHWLVHPVADLFPGLDTGRPELTVEVRCDDEPMTLRSAAGRVTMAPGRAAAPDLVLTGPPDTALALLAGRITPADAKTHGLAITGDPSPLPTLRPHGGGAGT
ncbi:winged helix-turn-helix transcriptional regulator [Streptomyces sp. CMB-StM0423]|uniref:winged helix-turn-helix transcriptional regulator n=1 Tax=Streptomyces sp. CMB-StM0423 TaxID=2059884 RepID=UPI0018FE1F8E|nr:winged helix-turn-helix transcriptional regulator [Streptomyces sp. CMB-StM0423]